ncbi:alpha/beta fold hydrolase [Natrinema halophilum]|uniref:alpha/beta fold hydrolase n=1 Tax=Natrinema halophilum TaxID=1699371 RepID=UPI0024DF0DD8|nr:alpha/beta hydrolase [Natrinema halophilum]
MSGTPGDLLPPDEHLSLIEEAEGSLPEIDPLTAELSFLSDAIADLNTDRPPEFTDGRPTLEGLPIDPSSLVAAAVPAYLIAGEADRFMPRAAIEAVAERLEGPDYAIVSGAGHSPNFERPERFNRLVGDFLDENSSF